MAGCRAIAGTFSIPITMPPEPLSVRMPDSAVSAVLILPRGCAEDTLVRAGTNAANSFNDAIPTIGRGRGAADAALFRESAERMDQP
jgi:hypothetical protein